MCLMPTPHGSILGTDGFLCGHLPCMECTHRVDDNIMCYCCAASAYSYGSRLGGAGRLPRSEAEKGGADEAQRAEQGAGAGPGRWPPPEPDEPPPGRRERKRKRTAHPIEEDDMVCENPGCLRPARGAAPTCCEHCALSRGRVHSTACDEKTQRRRGPGDQERFLPGEEDDTEDDPDDADDGDGPGGRERGGRDRKAGKGHKKRNRPGKEQRARWAAKGKGRGKARSGPFSEAKFKKALTLNLARNSRRSLAARIKTWDRAAERLREMGMMGERAAPGKMSATELRRVAAYLKAQNYRSRQP